MLKILGSFLRALGNFNATPVGRVVGSNNLDNIELQILDDTGNWRTCHVTRNISPLIISGMNQLASQFPGKRVRAVDRYGNLVNIM